MTRFTAAVVLYKQPDAALAFTFKVSEGNVAKIKRKLFESVLVKGERTHILRPDARRQLDLLEHSRRQMFDRTRKAEEYYRKANDPNPPEDPIDKLDLTEHNRGALKQIRRKLGAPGWVAFMTFMYDGVTPAEVVAGSFPEVLNGPHDAVTWRRVLLEPPTRTTQPDPIKSTRRI